MTAIGDLGERISLQRATFTPDGLGGQTETWTEYARVWAKLKPLVGRERELQKSERQEVAANYVVTLRYRSDILESDKIVWRGRELNIRFMRNVGFAEQFMELEAELGADS